MCLTDVLDVPLGHDLGVLGRERARRALVQLASRLVDVEPLDVAALGPVVIQGPDVVVDTPDARSDGGELGLSPLVIRALHVDDDGEAHASASSSTGARSVRLMAYRRSHDWTCARLTPSASAISCWLWRRSTYRSWRRSGTSRPVRMRTVSCAQLLLCRFTGPSIAYH